MALVQSKIKMKHIYLTLVFICAMLSGVIPQTIQAVLLVCLLCMLFTTDCLYLVYPIVLFYYSDFGLLFGISVYRIFSILYIFKAIINMRIAHNSIAANEHSGKLRYNLVLVVMVFFLYNMLVMAFYNLRVSIFSMIDIISAILFAKEILADSNKFRKTFIVYSLTAIIAFFSGMIANNDTSAWQNISGTLVRITRFMATFNDPNYMGLFYSVAIFSIISLKLFSKKVRILIIAALYVMLATSLSITAIVGNVLFWIIYLAVTKKTSIKVIVPIVIVMVILGGLYQYSSSHRDIPVLGDLAYRIEDKLSNLKYNDTNALTTNRTVLAREHWNYYWSQTPIKIIIGGNKVNSLVIEFKKIPSFVAHNEYIDLLLNVGLIGTIILISFVFRRTYQSLMEYRKTKNEKALCVFMIKVIWIYYAATLTMFLEFRFMLFYFI